MNEIPTFALLFQNFEPYFIPTFSMKGTWKPAQYTVVFSRVSQYIPLYTSAVLNFTEIIVKLLAEVVIWFISDGV